MSAQILRIAERSKHYRDVMIGYHAYEVIGACVHCGATASAIRWGTVQEVKSDPFICEQCRKDEE